MIGRWVVFKTYENVTYLKSDSLASPLSSGGLLGIGFVSDLNVKCNVVIFDVMEGAQKILSEKINKVCSPLAP